MTIVISRLTERNIEVRGDPSYRNKACPQEGAEQITLFNELRAKYPKLADVAIHPKNEGKRFGWQANADRMMGSLNTGASDVIIPGFPTCIVELKRQDRTCSSIEDDQIEYLVAGQDLGCWVCVALGWQAALDFIAEWYQANYENFAG